MNKCSFMTTILFSTTLTSFVSLKFLRFFLISLKVNKDGAANFSNNSSRSWIQWLYWISKSSSIIRNGKTSVRIIKIWCATNFFKTCFSWYDFPVTFNILASANNKLSCKTCFEKNLNYSDSVLISIRWAI